MIMSIFFESPVKYMKLNVLESYVWKKYVLISNKLNANVPSGSSLSASLHIGMMFRVSSALYCITLS